MNQCWCMLLYVYYVLIKYFAGYFCGEVYIFLLKLYCLLVYGVLNVGVCQIYIFIKLFMNTLI